MSNQATISCEGSLEPKAQARPPRLCLCCGRVMEKNRRRYCTQRCKDEFVFKLKWFNNLLRVLGARYATFSFTESVLILNVIPANTREVHTYFYHRRPGIKPAQDMNGMVFQLGELWWVQKEKTKSERFASRHILGQGHKRIFPADFVKPVRITRLAGVSQQMTHLRINREDLLNTDRVEEVLKSAYRRAALRHHPDRGGSSEMFRRIRQSYEDLKAWLQNPSYHTRRGVPGQWCFIGGKGKWVTPL